MNDISKDIPIYDNINHLIKNNKKSNKNFKKFFNSKNLSYNLPKDYIRRIRLKDDIFQHVELTNLKKDRLTDLSARNSSKKTAEFGKNFNLTQTPNKKEYKSEIEKEEQVMKKNKSNKRKPILINSKKKYNYSNSLKDYRFFLKSPKISFNTEAFKLDNNPVINNIIPIEKKSRKSFMPNRENKNNFLSLQYKKLIKRLSSKIDPNNINYKTKEKNDFFKQVSQKNLQIPTLNEINNAINKAYIDNRLFQAKEELNDLENNEVTKIINNLSSQKKLEKTNYSRLTNKGETQVLDTISNFNNSEQKELNPFYTQIDKTVIIPEDILQKKYRKLFLSKILYDSLDDEEIVDEEIIL